MKKKIIIALIIVTVLAVLVVPFKTQFKEGGTTMYTALAYRVIVWRALMNEGERKTGTEFHFFPNNFHDYEYYFERSSPTWKGSFERMNGQKTKRLIPPRSDAPQYEFTLDYELNVTEGDLTLTIETTGGEVIWSSAEYGHYGQEERTSQLLPRKNRYLLRITANNAVDGSYDLKWYLTGYQLLD